MSKQTRKKKDQWEALTQAFDSLDLGVSIFDAEFKLIFTNDKLLQLLGFPQELKAPGTSLEAFLRYNADHGEYGSGDPEEQVRVRIEQAKKLEPHRFDRVRPDGSIIEIWGRPIPSAGFITTYTDVTDLRHSEEALKAAYDDMEVRVKERTHEVEEKSRLLETTLENISQAISFYDNDLKLAAANSQFFKLLDFPQSLNKPGTPLEEFFRHNAKRGEYGKGDIEEQVAARMKLAKKRSAHRFRRPRLDGTILEVVGHPLSEGGFVTTYTDVSEEAKAIEALEIAKKEAESANRSKSEFLANMSHELRTPLNAIIGFSEAVSMEIFGPITNEKYREYAENIHDSGVHLLQLINEILDVSVIEAGKLVLDDERISMVDVAESSLRLVETRANDQGVNLIDNVGEVDTELFVDARRTRQILINLLSNAIKFTPKGGEVELATAVFDDDSVSFVVSDTGIGMTPEGIEKALTPFGQVEGSLMKSQDGIGLGLPLTNELIKAHGGHLDIASTPGKGTVIHVIFPAERVAN